jgi:uncharacterized membrane protein YbhN (UPF0104 family)
MRDLSRIDADLGPRPRQSVWRQLAPWAVGVLVLLTVVLAAAHFATLEQFASLASGARVDWFLLAVLAQVVTFPCEALAWRQALSRAGYPQPMIQTVGLEIAGFALDALTLWLAFHALGAPVPTWTAFVSFMIASMTATIGPIPLGLGTFEAGCVGMLVVLGVAVEPALAATLLLRGLTFWLPMIPGLWLAKHEIAKG